MRSLRASGGATIEALEAVQPVELLITRVSFPDGTPHGVSLASMALTKERAVRVLFVAREVNRPHTEALGEFLAVPVTGPELVATVRRMLAEDAA